MTDELLIHWALHEIDEEAVRLEAERTRFPEQRRAFEARVVSERRKLETLDQRTAESAKRRREREREIAALEAQEQKYRTQLDAVTNQQQFEAVQHEIAGVAGKRSDLETEVLTLMDDEERAATARPGLADALAKAQREGADGLARLDAEDGRISAALAQLAARRTEVEAKLDPASRARVQRIRAGRAGRAVSAILKDACGGCFRVQPPHALQEARKRDHLLTCDGCGRLIMLPPEGAEGA